MVRRGESGGSDGRIFDARLRDRRSGTAHRNILKPRNIDRAPSVLPALMRVIRTLFLCLTVAAVPAFAGAADLNCKGPGNVEEFRYSWRMRGGLAWIAGLVFPTSGIGELKTTFPQGDD